MKVPLEDLEAAAHGKRVWRRFKDTDVLVIDEISMMENHHFERLNKIMRHALNSHKPFGGVQLVVTGDFCQLPPVQPFKYCIFCGKTLENSPQGDKYTCRFEKCVGEQYLDIEKWAFRSDAWQKADFVHVSLTTIHRQKDSVFKAMLEKSRIGTPWSHADKLLLLNHPSETKDAVKLFPLRSEVKAVNDREFARLLTRKVDFRCYEEFNWNSEHSELQWKDKRSPDDGSLLALKEHRFDVDVSLKEGMLVVLLYNMGFGESLVNGSQGIAIGFKKHAVSVGPKQTISEDAETRALVRKKNECIEKFIKQAHELEWPVV